MNNKEYLVESGLALGKAVKMMSSNRYKALIIQENQKVVGVFTRRDMVKCSHALSDKNSIVDDFMNKNFYYISDSAKTNELNKFNYSIVPILNSEMGLVDIYFKEPKVEKINTDIPVVIMAGGLGSRLLPYTEVLQKPLVPVNGVPMIVRIMNRFHKFGVNDFHLVVNHKKEMIKAYFGDNEFNYKVGFAEETKKLGTGGGLFFVKDKIKSTFFLTNCDILLKESYKEILEYHFEAKNIVTVVVSVKSIEIPYGVVEIDNNQQITLFDEKPTYGYLTNTGVYVVEPEMLEHINSEEEIDFPALLERAMSKGYKVGIYPVTEDKWVDMGQVNEYLQACQILD